MSMPNSNQTVQTFEFVREELIEAPIRVVFQATLDELGPESQGGDGSPMPLKLDARPGGLWVRDLGNGAGHFWGHVQVIKPPKLIELTGPMFMSYPGLNHVQYRLNDEGKNTRLKFTHRAMGLIPEDHRKGMDAGWAYKLNRIRELAMRSVKH